MSKNEGSYYSSLCVTLTYRSKGKYNTLVLSRGKNACVFVLTLSVLILFHLTLNDSRVGAGSILLSIFQGQNVMKEANHSLCTKFNPA